MPATSSDAAYEKLVHDTYRAIERADAELATHAAAFASSVGCSPEVMHRIDGLYLAAEAAHMARIAELDRTFGDIRSKRDAYLRSRKEHAQTLSDDAAKVHDAEKSVRAIPLLDRAVADGLAAKAKFLQEESASIRRAIVQWCKPSDTTQPAEPEPVQEVLGPNFAYITDIQSLPCPFFPADPETVETSVAGAL